MGYVLSRPLPPEKGVHHLGVFCFEGSARTWVFLVFKATSKRCPQNPSPLAGCRSLRSSPIALTAPGGGLRFGLVSRIQPQGLKKSNGVGPGTLKARQVMIMGAEELAIQPRKRSSLHTWNQRAELWSSDFATDGPMAWSPRPSGHARRRAARPDLQDTKARKCGGSVQQALGQVLMSHTSKQDSLCTDGSVKHKSFWQVGNVATVVSKRDQRCPGPRIPFAQKTASSCVHC